MSRLPPELVRTVFQAIHDSSTATPYEWWTVSDECHRFFDNASLVCKMWYELTKPFRTFHTISGNTKRLPLREWTGGYARNGSQLAKVRAVTALHIDWMFEDIEELFDYFVLAVPFNLPSLLIGCAASLNSLSLQSEFLAIEIPMTTIGVYDVLQPVLQKVSRLHIYNDHSDAISYAFNTYTVIGCNHPWVDLANSVWTATRTTALRELALSELTILELFQDDKISPCPAETLLLRDVWFDESFDLSDFFPMCKHLIWIQTGIWDHATPANGPLRPQFTSTSLKLESIRIIWREVANRELPGDVIATTPNLQCLHFSVSCTKCQDDCKNANLISGCLDENMLNLQELYIEGLKAACRSGLRNAIREKLNDPLFCPKLARIPVEDSEEITTLHFLAK